MKTNETWNDSADVVVVGSGAAGLMAALASAKSGADVLLLEKSSKLGGSTSISGGQVWAPNNHHMAAEGLPDSPEEAEAYLREVVNGAASEETIKHFVQEMPKVIKYIEDHSPLRFHCNKKVPDYRQGFTGATKGGRSLDPDPLALDILGEWADKVHQGPHFSPLTYQELGEWGAFAYPKNIDFDLVAERMSEDIVTLGTALVAGLLKGCLDAGVRIGLNASADRLVKEGNKIIGIEITKDGEKQRIQTANGVILASGGFEYNDEYINRFLRGPVNGPIGVPTNTGDGLRMAMDVGADLGNLNEAWWCPTIKIDGEEFEDVQVYRLTRGERSLPGSIMVNRDGVRFVNEAANYNDIAKAFHFFDAVAYDYVNQPAWLVFDGKFRSRYSVMTLMPGDPDPDWMYKADTPEQLAEKVGINARQLKETIKRFNEFAKEGKDPNFRRGESQYDLTYGDPENKPNASLAPIEEGPYYALPVYAGVLGTKGGPITNENAQVLDSFGEPISGLYAAGNVAASIMGAGYPGAGATLGPALAFGYIAGIHSVESKKTIEA